MLGVLFVTFIIALFLGSIVICWWFWDAFGLGGSRSRSFAKEMIRGVVGSSLVVGGYFWCVEASIFFTG